jgi:hypothetical protein
VAEDALYVLLRRFVHFDVLPYLLSVGALRPSVHEGRAESAYSQRPNWSFVASQSRVFFEDRLRSFVPFRRILPGCSQGGYSDSEWVTPLGQWIQLKF